MNLKILAFVKECGSFLIELILEEFVVRSAAGFGLAKGEGTSAMSIIKKHRNVLYDFE